MQNKQKEDVNTSERQKPLRIWHVSTPDSKVSIQAFLVGVERKKAGKT